MRRFFAKRPRLPKKMYKIYTPNKVDKAQEPLIEVNEEPIIEVQDVEEVFDEVQVDEPQVIEAIEVINTPKRRKKGKKNSKSVEQENNLLEENISNVMDTKDKINLAASILDMTDEMPQFRTIKKEKGLIERTESAITILTEDNKELLHD